MSTRIRATLEECIQKWIEDHCEDDDWPSAYTAENMSQRMAEAAYAVFIANAEGQEYAKRQGVIE